MLMGWRSNSPPPACPGIQVGTHRNKRGLRYKWFNNLTIITYNDRSYQGGKWEDTRRWDVRGGAAGQTHSSDTGNTYSSSSSQVHHWRSHDRQHSGASKLCIQLTDVTFWLAEALCNNMQLSCCFKYYITHVQLYKWQIHPLRRYLNTFLLTLCRQTHIC